MRVLMFGWEFPPQISGGLGTACFGMTRALVELDHDITFVLPRLKPGPEVKSHVTLLGANRIRFGTHEEAAGEAVDFLKALRTEEIDTPLRPYTTEAEYFEILEEIELRRKERIRRSGTQNGYDLFLTGDYGPNLMSEVHRYARRAAEIAGRVPHDVIHTHDWLTMLAGLESRKVSGRPLVVHVHALEFDRSGEHVNQQVYDIERYGMTHADHVVAVSHYTKELIVDRYGIAPEKISVVYNGINPYESDERNAQRGVEGKVVLFLGRITFQKGPDYFVEAAARVLEKRDDVHFVMAGSGDMVPRIVERVAELRIGHKFHFTGFLNGPLVERMYRESDIYVMPSVSEPFGISPLEAMSHRIPVIISRQSGVSEILKNALKVDFWDIDDLANKIIALLDHQPLCREIAAQGAKELDNIRWESAAQRLTELYARIA